MLPHRITLPPDASFAMWRSHARQLLQKNIPPSQAEWRIDSAQDDLFAVSPQDFASDCQVSSGVASRKTIRRDVLALLCTVLCHASSDRFALAYRILWRSLEEPALLRVATDPDVNAARHMVHQIRRDAHKMKAFVRFRERFIYEHEKDNGNDRRHFVAWFEPEHHILAIVAPFFVSRFNDMNWLILTPGGAIAWDGETCLITQEPCHRDITEDETAQLWQTYYRATFNPARIKTKAMRSEMPRKYWKNLPETDLIPDMLKQAARTNDSGRYDP